MHTIIQTYNQTTTHSKYEIWGVTILPSLGNFVLEIKTILTIIKKLFLIHVATPWSLLHIALTKGIPCSLAVSFSDH